MDFINKDFKKIFGYITSGAFVFIAAYFGYYGLPNWTIFNSNSSKEQANIYNASDIVIDPNTFYEVTNVIDGDTFKVKISNGIISDKEVTVRMLGINTPETVDPRKLVECFGKEASDESKSLLTGKDVKLTLNPNREKTDKYDRLLAYVYLDGNTFVNELLVKEGYAREYTVGKAYQYQSLFKSDENQAREAGKGLWGACK